MRKDDKNMPCGLIIKGIGGLYDVKMDNNHNYSCKARGIFRKKGITPLPGDYVDISILDEGLKEGSIDVIHERKSCLLRPAVANVDKIIIIVCAPPPKPDFTLLDKLLIFSEKFEIEPVICVNKSDIDEDDIFNYVNEAYGKAGYNVRSVCALESKGLEGLFEDTKGKIIVFAGQSGVGKSTLLNSIFDKIIMPTGHVSDKIQRGKHTTRHTELIETKNGAYIADTPGFTSFELENMMKEDVKDYYPEFIKREAECKYNGCLHINEPECSVKGAVEKGDIDKARYERYLTFCDMLKDVKLYNINGKR